MNLLELLVLGAIWGGSFLCMRIAAPEFGPLALIFLRVGIAALVLLPVMRTAAVRSTLRTKAWPLFVVGITNSALPFTLFAYSTLTLSAAFDAILNSSTPIWTALVALVWLKTPITRLQLAGLAIGVAGVLILLWDKIGVGAGDSTLAVLAVVAATMLYGFSINYSKQALVGINPFVVVLGTSLFGTLAMLPFALATWPTVNPSSHAWAAVLVLSVVCTAAAYILFFRLIASAGSAYAASVTFIVPVFGMLWGALLLGEVITLSMLAGCVVVLVGAALASGKISWPRRRTAA